DLPAGAELEPLIAASMRDTVLDFADAIAGDRAPAVDAAVARHILEITVAAYASGAFGTTVRLPLDGALFTAGVAGLAEIGVPDDSFVRRRG
ncbi:Gfo/Idh/MocA family protein, partial [Mycobacterium kansasii]